MAVTLLSKSAYARHRGCDEKAVRKAIAEGRITPIVREGRELIDPVVADIQWEQNTRARVDSQRPSSSAGQGKEVAGTDQGREAYNDARTRREAAEADLAELNLAKELGRVIDRDRAVAITVSAFRLLRDGGMVMGRKLASQLAAMTDSREIQLLIDGAQREHYTTFAVRTLPPLIEASSDGLRRMAAAVLAMAAEMDAAPADAGAGELEGDR